MKMSKREVRQQMLEFCRLKNGSVPVELEQALNLDSSDDDSDTEHRLVTPVLRGNQKLASTSRHCVANKS